MTWIQTFKGSAVDLIEPTVAMIDIEDIARGLAFQCRYNGHTSEFYSVAQHSVLVSDAIEDELIRQLGVGRCGSYTREQDDSLTMAALWGLMHDAAEAYCGDVVSPVKQILRQVDDLEFDDTEARVMAVIAQKFGLAAEAPAIVRDYDLRLLATERRDLFGPCERDWRLPCEPLELRIEPWSMEFAEQSFLRRFDELGRRR